MVLIQEGDKSEEAIIETFNILRTFFNDKKELSDNELIGLYAELYTICSFMNHWKLKNTGSRETV